MIDDERPDAPQEGAAPEEAESQPGAPEEDAEQSPSADAEPTESADAEPTESADAEPTESADAEPPPAADEDAAPAAGDEPLTQVEDQAEEITDAPAETAVEPEAAAEPQAEPAAERPEREREGGEEKKKEDVVPGAHLEPDLVLEDRQRAQGEDEFTDRYAPAEEADGEPSAAAEEPAERPSPRTALDLAADARYLATGKRKTSVARVILRPGDGAYTVNGRSLEDYFPRPALQKAARQPLQTAGFEKRMDVVAKLHGGGISAQAGALRHGVARALVEADPSLRVELKRRGYLSRDARAKERKKAGLKKARKRPQFSKR